jgi:Replication-relaxation
VPSLFALPGRPRAGRLARSPQLAAALAARLTTRDRWLLRMICEHRVLTTGQITQLAFGTSRAATARLTVLYQYRAIDRFRPLAPAGSSPLHFILDEAGAMLLAAEDGITTGGLGYRRDRSMAIALSPRLAHNVGANGIFTGLAAAARASGGRQTLECWWGERRCAAAWGDHARPDGYGRWSKAYWTADKDVCETVVLSAMKAIPAELAPEFGDGKVFGPNRDVRFSAGGKSRTRLTLEPSLVSAIGSAG